MSSQASEPTLAGRWAVVTGGSSGIGGATALKLAAAGANVWIHGRSNQSGAESICERIERLGRQARCSLGDLRHSTEVEQLVDATASWGESGPDIWINNAGADVLTGPPAAWTFEDKLQRLWEVDVVACVRLSRAVGRRMLQAARGADEASDRVIINTGWDQAEQGMEGDSGEMFAATKGAVMAFTRSLAKSLAPRVRVNCVAPGWIQTAWGEEASEYWRRRARRESLLDRWGAPEDVAAATCFLASPAASFLTGVTLPVNGGFRNATSSSELGHGHS